MASGASKKKSAKTSKTASFKLYQREEFLRELEAPGIGQHIFLAFKMIFSNYKIFLPLLIIMSVATIGILGFLNLSEVKDVAVSTVVFMVISILWLMTIFVLRHKMAGNKVGVRDTLYNALTPLLSSLVVLVIVAVQAVPIVLLIVAYSSAIETHFLDQPFYVLLFLVFAGLMILLTSYLWSSTLLALVSVSAPGLYPLEAIKTANELVRGRRIKFVLRLIALIIVLFILWALTIWPMAVLVGENPAISIVLTIVGCFSVMYIASYLYLYYRWMLKFDTEEENGQKRSRK